MTEYKTQLKPIDSLHDGNGKPVWFFDIYGEKNYFVGVVFSYGKDDGYEFRLSTYRDTNTLKDWQFDSNEIRWYHKRFLRNKEQVEQILTACYHAPSDKILSTCNNFVLP